MSDGKCIYLYLNCSISSSLWTLKIEVHTVSQNNGVPLPLYQQIPQRGEFQFRFMGIQLGAQDYKLEYGIYLLSLFLQAQDMMLSLESLAYKADDAGGEFNAAQREVRCQRRAI